jgi:hypothetical protein
MRTITRFLFYVFMGILISTYSHGQKGKNIVHDAEYYVIEKRSSLKVINESR